MGTRADFYVGRGKDAKWLGSIAWDGYPDGIEPKSNEKEQAYPGGPMRNKDTIWKSGCHIFESKTEHEFVERVDIFFKHRDDVSLPEHGWPWPWDDSNTTDYAYAFDNGKVYVSCFGSPWFDPTNEPDREDEIDGEKPIFPNMKSKQNVQLGGHRSGLIVVGGIS